MQTNTTLPILYNFTSGHESSSPLLRSNSEPIDEASPWDSMKYSIGCHWELHHDVWSMEVEEGLCEGQQLTGKQLN